MRNYLMLAGSLFVFGCASTSDKPVKLEYADLAVSYNEMESAKWQPVSYTHLTLPTNREV